MLDSNFITQFVVLADTVSKDAKTVYLELLSLSDSDNFVKDEFSGSYLKSRRVVENIKECLIELVKNGLIVEINTSEFKGFYVVTTRKYYELLLSVRGLDVATLDNQEQQMIYTNADAECEEVISSYNVICKSLSRAYKLTDKKKRIIGNLLITYSVADLKLAFQKVEESDFLCGRINNGFKRKNGDLWKPGLEWILYHIEEILDGKYENRIKPDSSNDALTDWGGGN